MEKNPLLDKIKSNQTSLGLFISDPDMVELCAFLGFDWFVVDMMFTGNDWAKTEMLIRTGEAAGITPIVRVQSNPWLGYNHQLAVDVTRALGIGAGFVFISNSGKREIEECIEVSGDWHRKALHVHPFRSLEEWDSKTGTMQEATYIVPQPESLGAFEELEATIELPGVKALFLAMTDASKVLTDSARPDWYDDRLWQYVDKAVALGRQHGVVIGANTSYAYNMDELAARVKKLNDAGVKMIMVQTAPFLFQVAIGEFLNGVKGQLGI